MTDTPTIKVYTMRPLLTPHKGFKSSDQPISQGGDQS
jgi:hypothetical protein